ncbi:MAG TPA: hypothetical protein VJ921_08000 [Vicinamibacteria bacterium]|nr:hypothetical protein [Vicinamibacteria bacterium]
MGPQGWASVAVVGTATIQSVLSEFLHDRCRILKPVELRLYGHVLLFLQLCINNYGHRNLDEESRAQYETLNRGLEGAGREFFELFGPELLLPELDFFTGVFLLTEVHTSDKVVRKAKEVVSELRLWLVARGYVSPEELLSSDEAVRTRERLKKRLRPLLRRFDRSLVTVDPSTLLEEDYVALDAHLVGRVEPGRVWLRVHRRAAPEEIGPIAVPGELTSHLRKGFALWCSLGRLRGRWRLLELSEVHPRG